MTSSTLNSISIAWSCPSAGIGGDIPLVLGYHVQYRGSGRAAIEADVWKRASSFQVLSFEEVARERTQPPISITVFGLSSDTGYCFRIRARSAGGWGPFSNVSPEFRTQSYSSIHDQYSTVQQAITSGGAQGLAKLMKKHSEVRSVQQHCTEELAKIALRRKFPCFTAYSLNNTCLTICALAQESHMGGRDRSFCLLSTSRLSCRFASRCRNSSEISCCNAKRVSSLAGFV